MYELNKLLIYCNCIITLGVLNLHRPRALPVAQPT